MIARLLFLLVMVAPAPAAAQPCPEKNILYWQAVPTGGEPDIRRATSSSC